MAKSQEIEQEKIIVAPDPEAQTQASLGELLSAARAVKKLSQQDVSNSLRFSVKQIDALEKNIFDALPDAMTTRGFIRNYARLLDLDAEPLLVSYRASVPDKLPGTLSVQTSMHQVTLTQGHEPWLKYILGSILVLLFLLAWFFYVDYLPKSENIRADKLLEAKVETKPTVEISLPDAALAEMALPAAERQAESGTNTIVSETENLNLAEAVTQNPQAELKLPIESKKEAALKEASLSKQLGAVTQPSAVKQPGGQSVISVAVDSSVKKVSISALELTWVRVTDKSGKVMYEKNLNAGATDTFDVVPPFNLLIGNAHATKLSVSGQAIDLVAHTKRNVARLTLE